MKVWSAIVESKSNHHFIRHSKACSIEKKNFHFKCWIMATLIFGAFCLTQDLNQNGQEHFWYQFYKAILKILKSPSIWTWWISEGLLGFQASSLKLLPEVLLTILIEVLCEAGSSKNFGSPEWLLFGTLIYCFNTTCINIFKSCELSLDCVEFYLNQVLTKFLIVGRALCTINQSLVCNLDWIVLNKKPEPFAALFCHRICQSVLGAYLERLTEILSTQKAYKDYFKIRGKRMQATDKSYVASASIPS